MVDPVSLGRGLLRRESEREECPCPDYEHRTSKHGVGCAYVYGVAIAATRRRAVREARSCDGCGRCFRNAGLFAVHAEHIAYGHNVLVGVRYCRPCAQATGVL